MYKEERLTLELIRERQIAAEYKERLPEEGYYVNKKMFFRLVPTDIPQPEDRVYRG